MKMMKDRDYVRTIEAIYAVDLWRSPREWLTGVLESSRRWLDDGTGMLAYAWRISNDGIAAFEEFVSIGTPQAPLQAIVSDLPPEIGRITAQILQTNVCGFSSRVLTATARKVFFAPLQAMGIADTLGINGRETGQSGAWIGANRRRRRALSPRESGLYRRLARHLAAGSRLQRRLTGRQPTDADAAAILTPAGRIEHATPIAAKPDARAALRAAVLEMDRARGPQRRTDPEGAVRRWRVLADARFSLIDRFEADGRRYVVACENGTAAGREPRLTDRERQVVALYRLGADSKLIAYELGLADATVRVLLSRAGRRLGLAGPRALRSTANDPGEQD